MTNNLRAKILILLILWLQFSFVYLPTGLATEPDATATQSAAVILVELVSEEEDTSEPEGEEETEVEIDSVATGSATTGNLTTGDAHAEVTLVNEINTNIIADDYAMAVVVADEEAAEGFDLSALTPQCREQFTTLTVNEQAIIINNYAEVENMIEASADTGNNDVVTGEVNTGNATAAINLINLVNTNLIGNCWFFGMLNFFDPYSGEIILPYEQDIISGTTAGQVHTNLVTDTQNEAGLSQTLTVDAQTGNNLLSDTNNKGEIQSGQADAEVQTLTTVNNNYLGHNWLLIEIRNPQYWGGSFAGLNTHFQQVGDSWYYWLFPENATNSNHQLFSVLDALETEVKINNTAQVTNQLTASANTGGNVAAGSDAEITTGDAASTISVFNQLNTNIIGNNWYYLALNLFNPFTGTIVFPRADVTVAGVAAKKTLYPGESTVLQLAYANNGREMARDTKLNLFLPVGVQLLESSAEYESVGPSELQFELGVIGSQEVGFIDLLVAINPAAKVGSRLTIKSEISTNTLESNLVNNQSQLQLALAAPATLATPAIGVGGIKPEEPQLKMESLVEPEAVYFPIFPAQMLGITNFIPRAQAMTVDFAGVADADDSSSMCLAYYLLQCRAMPASVLAGKNPSGLGNFLGAMIAKLLFAYASIT